ncbi:uncharacterized protein LOC144453101 [Glandiceps talaboti]
MKWQRSDYKYFLPIQTRWSDNDQYGHVNNVIYYSYFDTVINHFLIKQCDLNTNIKTSEIVGLMVDTGCSFKQPLQYPDVVLAALAISHIGRSSVKYTVAIFAEKSSSNSDYPPCGGNFDSSLYSSFQETASAVGSCTHVFVDAKTNRSKVLPDKMRQTLQTIVTSAPSKL